LIQSALLLLLGFMDKDLLRTDAVIRVSAVVIALLWKTLLGKQRQQFQRASCARNLELSEEMAKTCTTQDAVPVGATTRDIVSMDPSPLPEDKPSGQSSSVSKSIDFKADQTVAPNAQVDTQSKELAKGNEKMQKAEAHEKELGAVDEHLLRRAAKSLDDEKTAKLNAIFEKGNAHVCYTTKRIKLKESIDFKAVHHGSQDAAEFKNKKLADDMLHDVAGILSLVDTAKIDVEGHSATPDKKIDDWAHALALSRAELVKSVLVSLGVSSDRVHCTGLPGYLGIGKPDVLIKIRSV